MDPVALSGFPKFLTYKELDDCRGWAGESCVSREEAGRQETLACDAMWFYAPIVLGDWGSSEGHGEAHDFSGMMTPETWKSDQIDRLYGFLCENFYTDLDRELFDTYLTEKILAPILLTA